MKFLHQAVLSTPADDPNLTARLNNLGLSYQSRFEYLGDLDDLEKALEYIQQAIQIARDNHPSKPKWLSNLGISYHSRFELLGNSNDLEKSINCKKEALLATHDGDPDKPAYLGNLGISYQTLFEIRGYIKDIDEAISYTGQAIALSDDDHIHRPLWLNNLGSAYRCRFERLGEISDIDQAIKYEEEALLLTPDHQINKPERLNNLGNAYLCRFELLGNLEDIKNAIRYQNSALQLTPDDHPNRPRYLTNLGNSLLRLFHQMENLEHVKQAIKYQEKALALLVQRDNYLEKPALLNSLGLAYMSSFERLGDLTHIDNAIRFQQQAVELIPATHPAVSGWLWNLGNSLVHRYEKTPTSNDIEHAIDCFRRSACLFTGPPSTRLQASRNWAKLCASTNISPIEAYKQALDLIPRIVWLGSSINRRYEQLIADAGSIATEAAAAAIEWGQDCRIALEWLEEGRSVVWNQMMQLRSPFDALSAADSNLAEKLKMVAQELERGGNPLLISPHMEHTISLQEATQRQHSLAEDWDNLLEQARLLPGLQNLLQPKIFAELASVAQDRTVAVINVHHSRCDALVLTPRSLLPVHIPLPRFSIQRAEEVRFQLSTSIGGRSTRSPFKRRPVFDSDSPSETSFENALAILWTDIVEVILKRLDYLERKESDELPHVVWCSTGPLAFLPLHAAGLYSFPQVKVFNHVVSSYTPSLSALLKPALPPPKFGGILAVGQEAAAGSSALPGTVAELDKVQKCASPLRFTRLEHEDATRDAVLHVFEEHSWVHLAVTKPQRSAFQRLPAA
ncbi:hypothetical protein FRC12_018295 [Ceratobasidium sp. 428]|nr:hypothetical protein FRC12_018295 [Ceratobasidium sp. 428]